MWTEPWFVVAAYGLPLLAVFGLNLAMAPRSDASLVTVGLIWLFAAEMGLLTAGKPPQNTTFLAMLDLIGGLGVWLCWRSRPARWKMVMVWLFALAIGLEALKWAMITFAPDLNTKEHRNMFRAARNVISYASLVCAGWTGGARVADRLGRLLSSHSPGRGLVGAGR